MQAARYARACPVLANPAVQVVLVNKTPLTAEWNAVFTDIIIDDCDDLFARVRASVETIEATKKAALQRKRDAALKKKNPDEAVGGVKKERPEPAAAAGRIAFKAVKKEAPVKSVLPVKLDCKSVLVEAGSLANMTNAALSTGSKKLSTTLSTGSKISAAQETSPSAHSGVTKGAVDPEVAENVHDIVVSPADELVAV